MSPADDDGDFERWLDGALGRAISAEVGTDPPPPRRFPTARGRAPLRTAVTVCAVVLGIGGIGAALATGSPNPVSWGHQVIRSVSMGALTPQRSPTPAPAGPPARPAAPAAPGQSDRSGGQSNASADKSKQQGGAGGSLPPGQSKKTGQGKNGQAHGHRQGANQQR
jgi:hypothetical protein